MIPAIRTEGLRKVYRTGFWMRKVVGLERLDLELPPGEVFGFLGPNGAGKTTTLKVLAGLHRPTEGNAWIHGKPCDDPATRRVLGFLPERPYFYEHLTARELLDFYGRLLDLPADTRRRRSQALLERLDMFDHQDLPLRQHSKGMLQRIGLCQALLNDPQVIVLDEPMSGLDPVGRALVREVILEQRALGRTVMFSSHILSDVQEVCDRIGILVGGRIRAVGTLTELLEHQVRHVECLVRVSKDVSLPGQVERREGERAWVRVGPGGVDELLRQVQQQGGEVVRVTPVGRTLEDLFMEEVGHEEEPETDTGTPAP
ncbi:MAG: ABC transporter ATP-binding protein [Myxococcota bacterium]|jgi:ABC-2 type transport system ATP-binding protein|nr:ABC transporter ATP-binding protein [Myxococcota bacterium]